MKSKRTTFIILLISVTPLIIYLNLRFAQEENYNSDFTWKGPYSEGLAPVLMNGKYGYVDINNQLVIEPKFLGASDFNQGLAVVYFEESDHDEGIAYIDQKGNVVKTFLDILKENSVKEDIIMKDYYSVMANPGLLMRASPSSSGEKIMLIPFGEKVKALRKTDIATKVEGVQGFWYLVEYKGKQGYVFGGFLSRISIKDFYENYLCKMFGEFAPDAKIYLNINTEGYLYIDPSGIIYIFIGVLETDNAVAMMYVPHISMEEVFWFLKNYFPDLMVLKIGDIEVETLFKNLDYPINDGQIELRAHDDIEETLLTIEKEQFGYVRIEIW